MLDSSVGMNNGEGLDNNGDSSVGMNNGEGLDNNEYEFAVC
jgi:hypothetical protein